eukprot:TRINITY_DN859_c0_g1_i3.p1 TRINITY_DN859_c0_g1~~TRINITY_DN859_c0_g1_i3.p1  ORF type:complete len:514 (+),score=96.02 TRINITY_DN859_c0_g1_i3:36-1577(+)
MDPVVDVVVVGAGISGLRAAQFSDGTRVDLGGQWVGKTQTPLLDLLKELQGIKLYPQFDRALKIYYQSDSQKIHKFRGTIPWINPFALLDLELNGFQAINRLSHGINVQDPHLSKNAEDLDSQTVETWAAKQFYTEQAKRIFDVAVRMIFGAEGSEISLLWFLVYNKAGGGFLNLTETTNGAQEFTMDCTSYGVAERLYQELIPEVKVWLGSPVFLIDQSSEPGLVIIKANVSSVLTLRARRVIIAAPPSAHRRIQFVPDLPVQKQKLNERFFMANYIKIHAVYKTNFWRAAGYSGDVVPADGSTASSVLSAVFDGCHEHHHGYYSLIIFIAGVHVTHHIQFNEEQRKERVLTELERFYGKEAREVVDYIERDWTGQEYLYGAPTNIIGPGGLSQFGEYLRSPFGRLHFAGTETATQDIGYISGAVQAAQRAALEVSSALSSSQDKDVITQTDAKESDPVRIGADLRMIKPPSFKRGWFQTVLVPLILTCPLVYFAYQYAAPKYGLSFHFRSL